jgi:LacI family transcriptional regulator
MGAMSAWTISDVAREAKVSKTTVSRVLNDRPDVDAETAARVRALIADVGFVRRARAVQLAHGQAHAVGLLGPFDTSPWMIEVLRGAMEKVQAANISLTLHAFPSSASATARFSDHLHDGSMDALLAVSLRRPLEALAKAARHGLPVVALFDHGCNAGLPSVVPDEAVGIAEAVGHLVKTGRERFALIAGAPDNPVSTPRREAFRTALAARGIALDEALSVEADFTAATAEGAAEILLSRGIGFDALFALSDAMAVGAMRALKRRGIAIPRDLSVIGFDDFSFAEFSEPRLTTVHNPLYEMSARAVTRLLEAVRAKAPVAPGREVVRTHLIVRESSDPRRRSGADG